MIINELSHTLESIKNQMRKDDCIFYDEFSYFFLYIIVIIRGGVEYCGNNERKIIYFQ